MSVFKNLYQELTNNIIISVIIPYLILYLILVVFPVFEVLLTAQFKYLYRATGIMF